MGESRRPCERNHCLGLPCLFDPFGGPCASVAAVGAFTPSPSAAPGGLPLSVCRSHRLSDHSEQHADPGPTARRRGARVASGQVTSKLQVLFEEFHGGTSRNARIELVSKASRHLLQPSRSRGEGEILLHIAPISFAVGARLVSRVDLCLQLRQLLVQCRWIEPRRLAPERDVGNVGADALDRSGR